MSAFCVSIGHRRLLASFKLFIKTVACPALFAGNWPTNARPVLDKVSHGFVVFFLVYITIIVFAVIRAPCLVTGARHGAPTWFMCQKVTKRTSLQTGQVCAALPPPPPRGRAVQYYNASSTTTRSRAGAVRFAPVRRVHTSA